MKVAADIIIIIKVGSSRKCNLPMMNFNSPGSYKSFILKEADLFNHRQMNQKRRVSKMTNVDATPQSQNHQKSNLEVQMFDSKEEKDMGPKAKQASKRLQAIKGGHIKMQIQVDQISKRSKQLSTFANSAREKQKQSAAEEVTQSLLNQQAIKAQRKQSEPPSYNGDSEATKEYKYQYKDLLGQVLDKEEQTYLLKAKNKAKGSVICSQNSQSNIQLESLNHSHTSTVKSVYSPSSLKIEDTFETNKNSSKLPVIYDQQPANQTFSQQRNRLQEHSSTPGGQTKYWHPEIIIESDEEISPTLKQQPRTQNNSPANQGLIKPAFKSQKSHKARVMFSPTSKEINSDVNVLSNDKPKKQLKDIVSGLERQREKRKLKNSGDLSHYYYKKLEINQEVRRQRESVDFQKTLLMKKGLNREFIEEYKIMQMSKHFERRSKNPNLLRNKDQVMQSLLNTFTNKSFLNQLKQNNKEMEGTLASMGLDFDTYRHLANQMGNKYVFKNERKSLIERNEQQLEEIQEAKESKDVELFKNLSKRLRLIAGGRAQSQTHQLSTSTAQQSTHLNITSKSAAHSPDFSQSIIVQNDAQKKHLDIANDRQFKKLLDLVDSWYEVEEPSYPPYLRSHQNKYLNGLPSPQPTSPSHSPTSPSQSSGKRKRKKQNPIKFLMSPNHDKKKANIEDSEIQEYSKYINSLLIKCTDSFIKRKYQAHMHKHKKTDDKPNFFKRMQDDSKKRNIVQKVIKSAQEQGKGEKLSRLKKLNQVTSMMQNYQESNEGECVEQIKQQLLTDEQQQQSPIGKKHFNYQKTPYMTKSSTFRGKDLLQQLQIAKQNMHSNELLKQSQMWPSMKQLKMQKSNSKNEEPTQVIFDSTDIRSSLFEKRQRRLRENSQATELEANKQDDSLKHAIELKSLKFSQKYAKLSNPIDKRLQELEQAVKSKIQNLSITNC